MFRSFLVLWSICWSSSLVHFKNDPEYLLRRTAQVFILWWDSSCRACFWEVFSFVWDTLLLFLLFFHTSTWWYFLIGIWVITSLLMSPGLFKLLKPILAMLNPTWVSCIYSLTQDLHFVLYFASICTISRSSLSHLLLDRTLYD